MQVIRGCDISFATPCVAVVGFFDGVHLGHRYLLEQVAEAAKQRSMAALAVTFEQHPRSVLAASYVPSLLTTTEEKLGLMGGLGIDACAVLDFTKEFSALTSEEFMAKVLKEQLSVKCLMVGYDNHFGSDSKSGFAQYVASGKKLGIEVVKALPLRIHDITVSSSTIRRFIEAGNVESAGICLGREYSISGIVEEGNHIGRTLGFPTANMALDGIGKIIPAKGVYATRATIDGGTTYDAMTNIGSRPTIDDGEEMTIETNIFGFEGELYGRQLQLDFVRHLRDEKRFGSLDELKDQLGKDELEAKELLPGNTK